MYRGDQPEPRLLGNIDTEALIRGHLSEPSCHHASTGREAVAIEELTPEALEVKWKVLAEQALLGSVMPPEIA